MNATSSGFSLKVVFKGKIFLSITSALTANHAHVGDCKAQAQRPPSRARPGRRRSPVPEGGNEVEAAVHPVVDDVPPVQAALVVQVPLELLVDVADDGFKAERQIPIITGYKRQHP